MFKDQFRYLRKREGLTQAELAKKLHLSNAAIGLYETGKRHPDFVTLEEIADFFNVPMSFLIDTDEWKKTPGVPTGGLTEEHMELIDLVKGMSQDEVTAMLRLLKR